MFRHGDFLPIFGALALLLAFWLALNVYVTRRTWDMRHDIRQAVGDSIAAVRGRLAEARDWWRAQGDPEFAARRAAVRDYRAAVGLVLSLHDRAIRHEFLSERSSTGLFRRYHARYLDEFRRAMPEIVAEAARAVIGLSDLQIGFVAEDLSSTFAVEQAAYPAAAGETVAIVPARFIDFLSRERELLRGHPRRMETHADRLEDFIVAEAEKARAARKAEVRDADAP